MNPRWAIRSVIEVRSRIHINSSRPQFAQFDARLEPSNEHDGITVATEWERPADEEWLNAIELGVERFVRQRMDSGRPVCNTRLVMTRVISHPVDTSERTVTNNVATTLSVYFRDYESPVDVLEVAPDTTNGSV